MISIVRWVEMGMDRSTMTCKFFGLSDTNLYSAAPLFQRSNNYCLLLDSLFQPMGEFRPRSSQVSTKADPAHHRHAVIEFRHPLDGCGYLFARGAYEGQYWAGVSDLDNESITLFGGTFSVGVAR